MTNNTLKRSKTIFSATSNSKCHNHVNMLSTETEIESIGNRLSGGFTIKDILKSERSFDDLFEDKVVNSIERERADEQTDVFQNTNDDSPNKPSKAYSKYVMELQEKIQQRLLRKNGQPSSHSGTHFRFYVARNFKIDNHILTFNVFLNVNRTTIFHNF